MKKEKIIIIHNNKYDDQVQEIKEKLEEEGCVIKEIETDEEEELEEAENESIELPEELEETIDWSDILIFLIDDKSQEDDFINIEIEEAYKRGKCIVGIYAKGCEGDIVLPSGFKMRGNYMLGAESLDKLPKILLGENIPHEKNDGTKAQPTYKIHRVKCNKKR